MDATKVSDIEGYELFTEEDATTTDDKAVKIKKSMGRFRLEDLEQDKARLQEEIDEIDEKIEAIKKLK